MAVLVTGGAGYIGSHMAHRLVDEGEAVVVLDNLSTGTKAAVPRKATFVAGDVGDAALIEKLIRTNRVRQIVHFAGSIVVPDSVANPLDYYLNNTVKSRTLIACAVKGGVEAFVFSSTAAVYGEPAKEQIDESTPLAPMSTYGWSKLMTEVMLRDAAASHAIKYAVLRYFNVAGADPGGRTGQASVRATHLIKVATEVALGKRPYLEVYGTDYPTPDGTCIRDYIHVTDLIEAHVLALRHLLRGGESLTANCGYGSGFSVLEVIDAVRRVSGTDFAVRVVGRRPGDPTALVADSTLIRNELGWRPQLDDLDTIVRHALLWEKSLREKRVATA